MTVTFRGTSFTGIVVTHHEISGLHICFLAGDSFNLTWSIADGLTYRNAVKSCNKNFEP
jgi:hypothetical protein